MTSSSSTVFYYSPTYTAATAQADCFNTSATYSGEQQTVTNEATFYSTP